MLWGWHFWGALVRVYHFVPWFVTAWYVTCSRHLWGRGASIPLVAWFVRHGTCAPLVPWFVVIWLKCTTCTMVCGDLARVYHLYHGLWGPCTCVPLVPWFVGACIPHVPWFVTRVYHLYYSLWGPGMSAPIVLWFVGAWYECSTRTTVNSALANCEDI